MATTTNTDKPKSGRGGYRPGAGRKKRRKGPIKKARINIDMALVDKVAEFQRTQGLDSWTQALETIIREFKAPE